MSFIFNIISKYNRCCTTDYRINLALFNILDKPSKENRISLLFYQLLFILVFSKNNLRRKVASFSKVKSRSLVIHTILAWRNNLLGTSAGSSSDCFSVFENRACYVQQIEFYNIKLASIKLLQLL